MFNDAKLDFLIKNNYNVLLVGKKGVGKSSLVIDAFNRNKLNWLYFSASTLDPWVDFVGVPKEHKDENGNSYIDLIRPKCFQEDKVEAIFLDEYNRANKKIKNAVMELIQFKSINGKKFENLKIVWAAINPEDDDSEEYDVEKLDPAQKDRFHAVLEIPYKPDYKYFKNKYGEEIAGSAVNWWNELPKETKDLVSPRRLDYALDFYKNNGDIRDVIPTKANVSKLVFELNSGPITKILEGLFENKKEEDIKNFFAVENQYSMAVEVVVREKKYLDCFLQFFPEEKISDLISTNQKVLKYVLSLNTYKPYENILNEIRQANTNNKLSKEIYFFFKRYGLFEFQNKVKNNAKIDYNFPSDFNKTIVSCFNDLGTTSNISITKNSVYKDLLDITGLNKNSSGIVSSLSLEELKLSISMAFFVISRSQSYSINKSMGKIGDAIECLYKEALNKGYPPKQPLTNTLSSLSPDAKYGYIPRNNLISTYARSKIIQNLYAFQSRNFSFMSNI